MRRGWQNGQEVIWGLKAYACFGGVGKTEYVVSAVYWGSERGQSRFGCAGENQRPTCICLEVCPKALGESFSLRLPCALHCD